MSFSPPYLLPSSDSEIGHKGLWAIPLTQHEAMKLQRNIDRFKSLCQSMCLLHPDRFWEPDKRIYH